MRYVVIANGLKIAKLYRHTYELGPLHSKYEIYFSTDVSKKNQLYLMY